MSSAEAAGGGGGGGAAPIARDHPPPRHDADQLRQEVCRLKNDKLDLLKQNIVSVSFKNIFSFLSTPILLSICPCYPFHLNDFSPVSFSSVCSLVAFLVLQTTIGNCYHSPLNGSSASVLYVSNKKKINQCK